MGQEHLDRLSALDASFLAQEGPANHMQLGAVIVLEGPAPPPEQVVASIRDRLHLVPRYRQKLGVPLAGTARPRWIDDRSFALERHVRCATLGAPGDEPQLMALAAELFSTPLDRSRPLWEMWLVDGVADGRFALISKNHHALIDGIAGVDLAQVLFDVSPTPGAEADGLGPWVPEPEPSRVGMLVAVAADAAGAGTRIVGGGLSALTHPARALRTGRRAVLGLGAVARELLDPAPPTPLNVATGPDRRFVGVRSDLADFKLVKDALGGTVNDVVLAVVAGALRRWLDERGVRLDGLVLRALVPVSVRGEADRGALGNRLVGMRGLLPVGIADPLERLSAVVSLMDGVKRSRQVVGAHALTALQALAPASLLAHASRVNFSTRLFNLLATNVPGPQFPLYVQGRRMLDVFPVPFLAAGHGLAVAVFSYNGRIDFGLLGDREALHDLDEVGEGLRVALAELVDVARARSPARTSRPRSSAPASTAA